MLNLLIICCVFLGCNKETDKDMHQPFDPDVIPSMISYNDSILVSDSGYVQYKIQAAEIMIFDKSKNPYNFFPKKAYLEQYDSVRNVITQMWADSIWNFSKEKLWKLKGNVKIFKPEKGESYESDEFFWDEKNDSVYSNKPVTVKDPEIGTVRSLGFKSDINFTNVTFFRSKDGEFYVSDKDLN